MTKIHTVREKTLFTSLYVVYFRIILYCFAINSNGSTKYLFLENVKKKLLNIFSNFFFYLKLQSFRLIIGNNFIQMAASAGHAVAYTIGPHFKHIIDCVQLYFTNGFTNIFLPNVNCLWFVGVTLIFDGTPQLIVQQCQIPASRWPNDISSATDNAIFKNRARNIECSCGCVAHSNVLLKPNVINILLFNFSEQNFVQHGLITIAIDCNGLSLLIFEEKWPNYASGSKYVPNNDSF